jgi:putative membrane protein
VTRVELGEALALANACMNGTAAACIVAGWLAIRARHRELHRNLMLAAFAVSSLFLVSYLARVALTGTHHYPGHGPLKAIYLAVLLTHMTLAVATPPLVIRALFLALRNRIAEHRRIVRFTLPIWLYVSVTGVVVYAMLYHAPAG